MITQTYGQCQQQRSLYKDNAFQPESLFFYCTEVRMGGGGYYFTSLFIFFQHSSLNLMKKNEFLNKYSRRLNKTTYFVSS